MERHQDMTGRCRHLRDCSFERTMQSLCRRRGRRDGLGRVCGKRGVCERGLREIASGVILARTLTSFLFGHECV